MDMLPGHKNSFFVSRERPDGLRLKMVWDNDEIYCDLRLDKRFGAGTGTAPNAILFGIMDVVMWYGIHANIRKICVTRSVRTDFIRPLAPGRTYRVTSELIRMEGTDIHIAASIKDESGNVCVKADAAFRENRELSIDQALEQLDFTAESPEVKRFFQSLLAESHGEMQNLRPEVEYYPYGPM